MSSGQTGVEMFGGINYPAIGYFTPIAMRLKNRVLYPMLETKDLTPDQRQDIKDIAAHLDGIIAIVQLAKQREAKRNNGTEV
jgi:hypothetical protein